MSTDERGVAIDLSGSVKLRLTGPDALRYLNGQVSTSHLTSRLTAPSVPLASSR